MHSYVYLYDDETQAEAAFAKPTSPAGRRCQGKEVKEALDDADGYRGGDVTTSSLNIDPIGSDSAAGRFVLSYTDADTGIDGEQVIDEVIIREGRALAMIEFIEDSAGAFDDELRARLSSVAARRLRDLLKTP